MGENIAKLPVAVLGSALMGLTAVVIFDGLASSPMAPAAGDPFYASWVSIINTATVVIPLLVVGVPTIALALIAYMGSGVGGR